MMSGKVIWMYTFLTVHSHPYRSEIEPIAKLVKGGAWRKADTFAGAVAIWKAKATERKVLVNECQ
jgi:hypothetical protein